MSKSNHTFDKLMTFWTANVAAPIDLLQRAQSYLDHCKARVESKIEVVEISATDAKQKMLEKVDNLLMDLSK